MQQSLYSKQPLRFVKYLAAVWVALLFYAAASFLSGSIGINAYNKLDSERKKQQENLGKLRKINETLIAEKEALSYDTETIAQEALNIGYGRDGETYIRIEGFQDNRKLQHQAGEIFQPVESDAIEDEVLKIYALGVFLIALGIFGVTDVLSFIRNA
ncbi:MAG: septum formation initiator family protein [Spirochaetaceae bacterium]|jgi:cell division protein FtsB|nr:septum formation initiator family protein [Spirochaetaceae bacterium]